MPPPVGNESDQLWRALDDAMSQGASLVPYNAVGKESIACMRLRLTISRYTFEGAERPAVEDVLFCHRTRPDGHADWAPMVQVRTTLLRAILGLTPSRGRREKYTVQPIRNAYPLIGYVPQHLRFDPSLPLTGREMLHMLLRALPRKARCAGPLSGLSTFFRLASFLRSTCRHSLRWPTQAPDARAGKCCVSHVWSCWTNLKRGWTLAVSRRSIRCSQQQVEETSG